MASWEPTETVPIPSAQQGWRKLTSVHHAYDHDVVARLLPDPLAPDLFEGRAWVGITPFQLEAAVVPVTPGPRSTHVEVNVRTYAVHPDGATGSGSYRSPSSEGSSAMCRSHTSRGRCGRRRSRRGGPTGSSPRSICPNPRGNHTCCSRRGSTCSSGFPSD
jgi:hypothetical protein